MRTLLRVAALAVVILFGNGCLTSSLWAYYRGSQVPERITAASVDEGNVLHFRIDYRNGRTYVVSWSMSEYYRLGLTDDRELPASTVRTEIIPPVFDPIWPEDWDCVYVVGSEVSPVRKTEPESFVEHFWHIKIEGWDRIQCVHVPQSVPVNWCQGRTWGAVALMSVPLVIDAGLLPLEILGYLVGMWTFTGGLRVG